MSARLLAASAADADLAPLLREILLELRAVHATLRRSREACARALLTAIEEEFADCRFTTSGLLSLADAEPRGALAVALGAAVDMNASPRSRSTALGSLLSRLPDVEIIASQRGCSVYRLRTLAE